jgi:Uma2 family endonuclease
VAEIEKMAEDGYFREDDRFELVGGEIVPTPWKGPRREVIRGELTMRLVRRTPDGIFVVWKPQFNLADDTYLRPDTLGHPAMIRTPTVRGSDALLVVEVTDTSDTGLHYHLNIKVAVYAAHGVREYWVINAGTLTTTVHRKPSGKTYESVDEVAPGSMLFPSLVPAFAISLNSLGLD